MRRLNSAEELPSHNPTSGMWRGRLMVGRRSDGRPDVREVYAKSQTECRRKLDALKHQVAGGPLPASAECGSAAAYLGRWLDAKRGTIRSRTLERYVQYVRVHLAPALGKTKLEALRPDDLQRLYAAKLEVGLAPRTVHHIHAVMHNALAQAVKWGHVARNVADVVEPPTVPHRELHPPGADEVGSLLAAAEISDDRLRALWATAAYSGSRLGELCGLSWEDVDLEAGRYVVRRILVDVKSSAPIWGDPKTARSRRVVPLAPVAVTALRAHRARQHAERLALGEDYGALGLVFATAFGTPLQRKVVQEHFKRALARAGLAGSIRFHDLRHAAATLMLTNGVDIPTAAAILGHSQNSTTLNVYAHALPSKLAGGVAAIEQAIHGASRFG